MKKNRNTLELVFLVNSKKIPAEQLENMPLEFILKQNKELISNFKDLSRKISSLEDPVSVANQCVIGELSSVTKGSNCYNSYRNLKKMKRLWFSFL